MNNALKTKLLKRTNELLEKAKYVYDTHTQYPNPERGGVGFRGLSELRTGTARLIEIAAGENSSYYEGFQEVCQYELIITGKYKGTQVVNAIEGILIALRDDLEQDMLGKVENEIVRGNLATFLDSAQDVLNLTNESKDIAAFQAGTALENGLKKIAVQNKVPVKDKDDIGSLNTKLATAKVYSALDRSQIQTWKKIRDSVTHGKFSEYSADQVKVMIDGIKEFLARTL